MPLTYSLVSPFRVAMKFSEKIIGFCSHIIGMIVILLSVSGCGSDRETNVPVVDIQGTKIEISDDFTGAYCEALHDDTLIFVSYEPSFVSEAALLRNDSLIHIGYLNHLGQGPDDVSSASVFKSSKGFSSLAKMAGEVKLREVGDFDDSSGWKTVSIDSFVKPFFWEDCAIVEIREDSIILVGTRYGTNMSILSIIDLSNQELIALDFWPDDGYSGPAFPKRNLYSANSRLFSNGCGKYLYKTGSNRNAFIFSLDGNHVAIEHQLYERPIKYEAADDGMNFNYSPEKDGLRVYATPEAIYCLLIELNEDGETATEFNESNSGNRVEIYDWNGNLTGRLKLSSPAASMVVDDSDGYILTQSMKIDEETGQPVFMKYTLP